MRMNTNTSECLNLSEKICRNLILKIGMADLGRARARARARAPAANSDSEQIIRTRRIYNEWTAPLNPARQNHIVQSLGMVCGWAVAQKCVNWPKCSQSGADL